MRFNFLNKLHLNLYGFQTTFSTTIKHFHFIFARHILFSHLFSLEPNELTKRYVTLVPLGKSLANALVSSSTVVSQHEQEQTQRFVGSTMYSVHQQSNYIYTLTMRRAVLEAQLHLVEIRDDTSQQRCCWADIQGCDDNVTNAIARYAPPHIIGMLMKIDRASRIPCPRLCGIS